MGTPEIRQAAHAIYPHARQRGYAPACPPACLQGCLPAGQGLWLMACQSWWWRISEGPALFLGRGHGTPQERECGVP